MDRTNNIWQIYCGNERQHAAVHILISHRQREFHFWLFREKDVIRCWRITIFYWIICIISPELSLKEILVIIDSLLQAWLMGVGLLVYPAWKGDGMGLRQTNVTAWNLAITNDGFCTWDGVILGVCIDWGTGGCCAALQKWVWGLGWWYVLYESAMCPVSQEDQAYPGIHWA